MWKRYPERYAVERAQAGERVTPPGKMEEMLMPLWQGLAGFANTVTGGYMPQEMFDETVGEPVGATEELSKGAGSAAGFVVGPGKLIGGPTGSVVTKMLTKFGKGKLTRKWVLRRLVEGFSGATSLGVASASMKPEGGEDMTFGEEVGARGKAGLQSAPYGAGFGILGRLNSPAARIPTMAGVTGVPSTIRGDPLEEQAFQYTLGAAFGLKQHPPLKSAEKTESREALRHKEAILEQTRQAFKPEDTIADGQIGAIKRLFKKLEIPESNQTDAVEEITGKSVEDLLTRKDGDQVIQHLRRLIQEATTTKPKAGERNLFENRPVEPAKQIEEAVPNKIPEEQRILDVIGNEEVSIDDVIKRSGIDAVKTNRIITDLQLKGELQRSAGAKIRKTESVKEPESAVKESLTTEERPTDKSEGETGVFLVNPKEVKTDLDRFQNRLEPFSRETYNRIKEEGWSQVKQDAVVLWRDPKDNTQYVLKGHTRIKAAEDLDVESVKATKFEGSEAEAIRFAEMSNREAAPETLMEDIRLFKKMDERGESKKAIKDAFGSKSNAVEDLSGLNPKGDFLDMLAQGKPEGTYPYLERNARFIGRLRSLYPDKLTDLHEQQIFKFLYSPEEGVSGGQAFKRLGKEDLFEMIEMQISTFDFDPGKPLVLKRTGAPITGTRARGDTREFQVKLDDLRARREKALTIGEYEKLSEEIERLERGIKEIDRTQQDFFVELGKESAFIDEAGWLDISVLRSPVEKARGGVSDIAELGKRVTWTVEGRLRKGGKAANELADMLTEIDFDKARYLGDAMSKLNRFKKDIRRSDFEKLTGVIDDKFSTPETRKLVEKPAIQAFKNEWKAITDQIFFRAKLLGVMIIMPNGKSVPIDKHYVHDYVRRELTPEARRELGVEGLVRSKAIEHLIKTKQAKNEEDAIGLLGEWLKFDPKRVHYGSLERPRLADLPAEVYEQNFAKLLPKMIKRSAHFLGIHKHFGHKSGIATKVLNRILVENGKELYRFARKAVILTANGDPMDAGARIARRTIGITANIGLSSPTSGMKNWLLGDVKDAQHYGLRRLITGYKDLIFSRETKDLAIKVSAVESGVHDIEASTISKWNPGLMHPSERGNRIRSVARAVGYAKDALAILKGHKVPTWESAVQLNFKPKKHAHHVLKDVFRLSDVDRIVRRGYFTKHEIKRIAYFGQAAAQGITTVRSMPLWMSNRYAKGATLFYRMAYRASTDVWHNAVKPATKGNPGPLVIFLAGSAATGEVLYAITHLAFRREHPKKGEPLLKRVWKDLIHGEGAALFSNYLEGYGSVTETYMPAVLRNAVVATENMVEWATGKKFAKQAVKDTFRQTVSLYNAVRKAIRSRSKLYADYDFARRKVWDFEKRVEEKTFGKFDPTTRTPYYRGVRDAVISSDDFEMRAAFRAAFAYLIEKEGLTIDEAKSRCKSAVNVSNPVRMSEDRREKFYATLCPEDKRRVKRALTLWKTKKRRAFSILDVVAVWYGNTRFKK